MYGDSGDPIWIASSCVPSPIGAHRPKIMLTRDSDGGSTVRRYEKSSVVITSNCSVDDWGKLLGDVVVAAPLLDRIIHHGHLLKFEGKSWRMKEAAERLAKRAATAQSSPVRRR